MPRCLEPDQRFPYVLRSDRDKSPLPTFYFRAASARDYRNVRDALSVEGSSALDIVTNFLRDKLVDWQLTDATGAGVPFDADSLDAVCDHNELLELFHCFGMDYEDKKKSAS